MMPLWLNAVGFQTAWFVAVLGQQPWGWLALAWPLLHLSRQSLPGVEAQFILLTLLIGVAIDTLLLNLGVFAFPGHVIFVPLWLVVLWGCFATTLRHSLRWMYLHPLLPSLFGAVGGTLSYLAGYRFGAVELPLGVVPSAAILAVIWAILLPLLGALSGWLDRKNASVTPLGSS